MDFMPYIKDHFWRATGLCPDGIRVFMAWIKQGSYYHGVVAQQGHLNKCPHLTEAPLPTQPQITPSESCRESRKQAETAATSSNEPSAGATATPIEETPVAQAPVTQTPVPEAPTACSDTLAPMETGGVGDGQSWAKQVEAGTDEGFQKDRPTKRCQSQSRRHEPRPKLPFPL